MNAMSELSRYLPDAGFTTADLAPFPSSASAKSRTVAAGNPEGNSIEISNPYIRISDCFTGGKHPVSVLEMAHRDCSNFFNGLLAAVNFKFQLALASETQNYEERGNQVHLPECVFIYHQMSDEFRMRQQQQELQKQQQLRLQQQTLPKSPTSPQQFNRCCVYPRYSISIFDFNIYLHQERLRAVQLRNGGRQRVPELDGRGRLQPQPLLRRRRPPPAASPLAAAQAPSPRGHAVCPRLRRRRRLGHGSSRQLRQLGGHGGRLRSGGGRGRNH